MSEDESCPFKDEADMAAAVRTLNADINNELEDDQPVYSALDHSTGDTSFTELKHAFGEITNVYATDDEIYGEIELLKDNDLARQVIALAANNNGILSVSIICYTDGEDIILTGCDVVSEPAISNEQVRLVTKQALQPQEQYTDFSTELQRLLDLCALQRKDKSF